MTLSTNELIISIIFAVLIAGTLAFLFWKQRKQEKQGFKLNKTEPSAATTTLKLQAYERLILLADRIAIPNLVSRSNQPGFSSREMQSLLTKTLKQEFEHNITQQMYVSPEAWDAIRNLKEQNLLIINQIASFLPAEASGQDLNKSLLELVMQNPKISLHNVVADALAFEAKKIMD
ncbi:MAG: hypothetical protein Q8918_15465 [Bacteroidota bacterium]|nr:hypothetical protein [Bacteroidota bacterium]